MYRLTLTEHVRVLLVTGLGRREPLKCRAVLGRTDANAELDLRTCCYAVVVVQLNRQRRAIRLNAILVELPLHLVSFNLDTGDIEIATTNQRAVSELIL